MPLEECHQADGVFEDGAIDAVLTGAQMMDDVHEDGIAQYPLTQ